MYKLYEVVFWHPDLDEKTLTRLKCGYYDYYEYEDCMADTVFIMASNNEDLDERILKHKVEHDHENWPLGEHTEREVHVTGLNTLNVELAGLRQMSNGLRQALGRFIP